MAAFIAVALLLVAGAVTVIVMVNKGDSAAPAGPRAPRPAAPVVSAPDSTGPVAPQPFPESRGADRESAGADRAAQPASTPGQQEAEQAAGDRRRPALVGLHPRGYL